MNTPASRLKRVTELSTVLSHAIRGQPDALLAIGDLVACREHELTPPKGCRGALLFVSPTGVGKTESAKALAEGLFGDGCMAQFDASEFSQPQSLEVALGDGRELRGRLHTAYERVPEGVGLFDEIEKGCAMLRRLGQPSPDTPEPAEQVAFPALDQPFLLEDRPPGLRCYQGRTSFYHPHSLLQGMHLTDDTLTVSFSTAGVSVTGRGLHALNVHLSAHNVDALIEQGERYAAGSDAPVHVNRITESLK